MMPVEFAEQEDASVKRLKKLKLALKKSQAQQDKIDEKIKKFRCRCLLDRVFELLK